jgi:carboxypeptidase Q
MKLQISALFGALSLILSTPVLAQAPNSLQEAATRILQEAESNTRAMEILQYLSDWVGPRLSGSPQAEKAVRWTAERMRKDGLENVRLQPVMVPRWIRGIETAELLTPSRQKMPVTALGGSVGTPTEGITAEVIEVSSFEELARLGDKVAGKIVYYHTPLNPRVHPMDAYGAAIRYRSRGGVEAARHGAVASMIRSLGTGSQGTPHTGATYNSDDVKPIPHAALATEAGDLIHRLVAAGERPTMRLVMTCRPEGEVESANVIGELPGREIPEEIVVIASHLDTWDLGTGAMDAGFACAIAMEVPRFLKELGLVPRRTIRTVLTMTEEMGNHGAKRYADMNEKDLKSHFAAIEGDAGPDQPWGFRVSRGDAVGGTRFAPIEDAEPSVRKAFELVQQWAKLLEPIGATWVDHGGIEGSGPDIVPLGRNGVMTISVRNDQSRYLHFHHTDGDTFDKIDPQNFRRNLAAIAFMAYALAETTESFNEVSPRTEQ